MAAPEHRLRRVWQQRGLAACALWPLSLAYGALAALHRARARRAACKLPAPVIVVGNVVAGGAGKTPVTLAVAEHLQARGWRPGIVSRGYGRHSDDCREVAPDADPRAVGDEPLLLRRRADVPVFVARRRAEAARALLAAHPGADVLICDDGLQHLSLARDVEIVAFDARGIGNGWLLPAGPLREPWPRAPSQPVQLIPRTEPDGNAFPWPANATPHTARRALAAEAVRADGTRIALTALQGQPLVAVAGIARPEAFFAMLRAAGLTLADTEALPDHYDFSSWQRLSEKRETLICTEKDALKLWRSRPDALAAPLDLHVPPAFFAALDEALRARGYHPRTNPVPNAP
jgi:tetraacyldisaccharide 4'-kinase